MPNEFEAKSILKFEVKTDDPSQHYEILGKIGIGAFAQVFEVKRKSDGVVCALKFVEAKSDHDRNVIFNEVGLMMLCKDNDGILKCYECFDYKNRLWIFLEMMDGGALTDMLEYMKGYHTE